MKKIIFLFLIFSCFLQNANAICVYKTRSGQVLSSNSMQEVPRIYRKTAKCDEMLSQNGMTRPQDLELKGREGNVEITTNLGIVKLKWSKEITELLQRTPQRVVSNAMSTLSRTINQSALREELSNMNLNFDVVFFGKDIPYAQIPVYLITNCHPGWMVPPANIYISIERAYRGCNGVGGAGNVGDKELEKVMLHELGHVVENQLLGGRMGRNQKQSEGFATWFEMFSSSYSNLLDRDSVNREYKDYAKRSFDQSKKGFNFSGSAYDYARSSMYFLAIEEKQGLSGILELYKSLRNGEDFFKKVSDLLDTTPEYLDEKVYQIIW